MSTEALTNGMGTAMSSFQSFRVMRWALCVLVVLVGCGGGDFHVEATTAPGTSTNQAVPEFASDRLVATGRSMAADLNPANTESSVVIRRPSLRVEVREGSVAHFGVDADASSPITYQWLRDDKPIVGETGATLWLVVSSADHFARISVLVKAGDSATQSDSTALRVRRD